MEGAPFPRLPVIAAFLLASLAAASAPHLLGRQRADSNDTSPTRGSRFRSLVASPDAPLWRSAAALLAIFAFLLTTLTSSHYGYNVDEWFQTRHGIALVDWYARAVSNLELPEFDSDMEGMNHYGGFFEVLAEVASRASPLDRTSTRHLVTAWFGVLGLIGAYLLGAALHSRAAGFAALGMLLLTPRFYGHFFSNPKDLPFAVCQVFALLAICRSLPLLPRLSPARTVALGAAIGAGMGIRVGGVIALAYFALALAWWLAGELLRARSRGALPRSGDLAALGAGGAGVLTCAWLVMLAFWPWAQSAPIRRPLGALGYFQDIVGRRQLDFQVFFEGRDVWLSSAPRTFTLKWLAISMPEFAVLAAPAIGLALWLWARGRARAWPSARSAAWLLVSASILVPLATTAHRGVIQYDGIRHFLFIVPSLAVVTSGALVSVLYGAVAARLKIGLLVAVASLGGITAWDMWRLHPYQYVYFNRSVAGGLERAAKSFETDYLGLSYREGARWLVENYPPAGSRPLRITACPGFHANLVAGLEAHPERASEFRAVRPADRPDLALAFTRNHCQRRFAGRVVTTVERESTPLLYVIELRAP